MKVKVYDKVLLKDKRTASVVEILKEDTAYLVDVGSSKKDWETIEVSHDDIEKVL